MQYVTKEMLKDSGKMDMAAKAFSAVMGCVPLQYFGRRIYSLVSCYLLFKEAESRAASDNEEVYVNPLALKYAEEALPGEERDKMLALLDTYPAEAFALALFTTFEEKILDFAAWSTPQSLSDLALKILDVNASDKVADICCGVGSFLLTAFGEVPEASYSGFDVSPDCNVIASLRSELLGRNIDFSLTNAFDLVLSSSQERKFSKIFSNYPLGLGMRGLGDGKALTERLEAKYPWVSRSTSSDWIFNSMVCDLLEEDGKAVVLMTNGSLWNTTDRLVRKHFIEEGLVEAVIGMPNSILPYTNVGVSMLVFSHGNEYVRIIDASSWSQSGRRVSTFSTEDVDNIVEAFSKDGQHSCLVPVEDLADNDYRLNVERYLVGTIHFENGKPFSSVIKRITRGAPCNAKELDEMSSDVPTDIQYLMLANIRKGQIDSDLPYLKDLYPKYEKYCVSTNNLILSKNGFPYKVAISTVGEGKRILANGNLYIIEVDEEKANPYYLKAFFESEQGIAALKSITVGTAMLNIGVEDLKNLEIPIPSLEVQNRIALKYLAKLDEIKILQMSLEKAEMELANIFNEEADLG